jgi:uncharacterized protein (TIGR03086 family)
MSTTYGFHSQACALFGRHLRRIGPADWAQPTPCAEWDVRALVNHVVVEDLWTVPLLAGRTVAEVGSRFDGDMLGADPVAAYGRATGAAVAAAGTRGALARTVHLSFGDVSGEEYVTQLFVDHLVHSWDLARALGTDDRLPTELVDAAARWFADREGAYRSAGVIGPRPAIPSGSDPQTRLLAAFGRAQGMPALV